MENKSPLRHTYILNISEEQGKTIDKLEVSYSIKQSDRIKLDTTFTTTLPKTILADYLVYPDEKAYSFERYKTKFEYVIKINDYFYDDGYITSSYDGSSWSIDKSINEKNINLKKINYKLVVTDIDGVPIEDAKVEYTNICNSQLMKKSEVFTDSNGEINTYTYKNNSKDDYYSLLSNTTLDFKISKEGYYNKSGTLTPSSPSETINLIKPIDYLNKEFISSSKGEKLKATTIKFIDLILLQSLLSDSYLELQSINLVPFKEKDYLTFKFINTNSYNSLKLNKYDIGKLLFDEVIRKILNPLNDYLGDTKEFYGYDLIVVGHTKSFADEYASNQKINYRFLIPNGVVKSYKNKDISGQQVLDASVILMDDERIDLKLQ